MAALVATVGVPPLEGSLQDSGARSHGGDFEEGGRKKRLRLTKKTHVRKRFGEDPWEQSIPKDAATLRCAVVPGADGMILSCGVGLSHVDEPKGIG